MDEQKKSPSLNKKTDFQSCPNCGFPIRYDDKACMYCQTQFQITGWRLYHYFLRYSLRYFQQFRWRRRQKRRKSLKFLRYFKYFAFLGAGIALTLIGGYLFIESMLSNDFSNWIISLFFLCYGIYTLKTLYKKQGNP